MAGDAAGSITDRVFRRVCVFAPLFGHRLSEKEACSAV